MSEEKTSQTAFLLINGNQVYYLENNETIIGRSSESDLVISDPRVSRKHAKISIVNERYLLTDLNSSGGSYINGKPAVQKLLTSGDELTFAFGLRIIFGIDASMIPDDSVLYTAIDQKASAIVTSKLDEKSLEEQTGGEDE
jgi:pSer/pThr/pTyr-binding forkhead associated (FHA) protein